MGLRLAARVCIRVAKAELVSVRDKDVLLVERFYREQKRKAVLNAGRPCSTSRVLTRSCAP